MSTGPENRWRELGQSVCGVIVVLAVIGFCGSGILGDGIAGDTSTALSVFAAANDEESFQESSEVKWDCEEEQVELEYAHIWSMPTYADLRESILVLQQSRADLLQAAADGETEDVLTATQTYRGAVQEVRDGFATLKKRVDPDTFADASREFLGLCAAEEGQSVTPRELGCLLSDIWQ